MSQTYSVILNSVTYKCHDTCMKHEERLTMSFVANNWTLLVYIVYAYHILYISHNYLIHTVGKKMG